MSNSPPRLSPFASLRLLCGLLLALLLSACASLPGMVERTPSQYFTDTGGTALGRLARASAPEEGKTGFRLLPVAQSAFLTRVALAQRAERSIDLQTFVLMNDESGRYLLRALRDAAARGVRVRVLVDDLYTSGADELLRAFAAHPNVELRLFNPFPAGRSNFYLRFACSALDFSRVNHRMHNKLFVTDNAFAVAGGRNIADEYFMRGASDNFVDLDVLAAGEMVQELSGIFDVYWNSPLAWPFGAIVRPDGRDDAALREAFERMTHDARPPPPDPGPIPEIFHQYVRVQDEFDGERIAMIQARASAYADPTTKAEGKNLQDATGTVHYYVRRLLAEAKTEISGTNPYYVPGEAGLHLVQALRERGVRVKMTTNSLASTDEPLVHIGYVRYRAALLRAGMELEELSPALTQTRRRMGTFGISRGRLHAKAAVVDRHLIIMGSLNMDARSARRNTELLMAIDSPALAQEMQALMDRRSAYRLRLAPNREDLEWVELTDDGEVVHTDEPEASAWLRFQVWLLSPFVSDDDL